MLINKTTILFILFAVSFAKPAFAESNRRQQELNDVHKQQAAKHTFKLDGKELTLRPEPVYVWTNPTRNSVQEGAVFVWNRDGRPEIISTIFSHPSGTPDPIHDGTQ